MTKDDVVKKVCEIMDVKYSHYDDHNMGENYFPHMNLTSNPKIVCYSGMSPWEFAILEDMSVITPTSHLNETILMCVETLEKVDRVTDKNREMGVRARKEQQQVNLASQFLIENKCYEIINKK